MKKMQFDFDKFVNLEWYSTNKIPDGYPRWDSFTILNKQTHDNLEDLVKTSGYKNLKVFYDSGMNVEKRNKSGLQGLKKFTSFIDDLNRIEDVAFYIGQMKINGLSGMFSLSSSEDIMDATMNRCHLSQGGLNLPDRSYYLDQDKQQILDKYIEFLFRLGNHFLINKMNDLGNPEDILFIEHELAEVSKTKTDLRDPHASYNKLTIDQLINVCPNFDWERYFKEIGVRPEFVIVNNPQFFGRLNDLLIEEHLPKWKTYLKMRMLINCCPYTSMELEKIHFDFYRGVLSGIKDQKPLNERVMAVLDDELGYYLEKPYIEKYFTQEAKSRMDNLVENLRSSFSNRIQSLSWMGDITKRKALEKLDKMTCKIGFRTNELGLYKPRDIDYTAFELGTNYLRNVIICSREETKFDLQKIDKPVDKTEWYMPAQTINAYYNPPANEIVFPAGILQEPFFSLNNTDAQNYGAIGCIIGHEMTHGFDDQGRKFSVNGNLEDWWSPDDSIRFDSLAKKIDELYSASEVEGKLVNGKLTLGENIADLGGVVIALDALPNKSDMKHFFEAYAKIWRSIITPEFIHKMILTDPHSPPKLRVNNTLYNVPEFLHTYNVRRNGEVTRIW